MGGDHLWDAFGALGEWIGGLATIGTLFYLAYQIRQNTRSARSSAYQAASSSISEWTNQVASDSRLMSTLATGFTDPDSLDDDLRAQISMQLNALFRNYENIFYQWRAGAIGDDVWEGWSNQIQRVFWMPGVQLWWPNWNEFCHRDFRAFLENTDKPEREMVFELPRAGG